MTIRGFIYKFYCGVNIFINPAVPFLNAPPKENCLLFVCFDLHDRVDSDTVYLDGEDRGQSGGTVGSVLSTLSVRPQ